MVVAHSSPLAPSDAARGRGQNEFEKECVQLFGEFVQILGVPRSVGQIYGLLFASPRPLCFSEIVEYLGISKGSASQGLQLLRSLGAINEADPANKSQRNIVYLPELSLRRLVSGVLVERVRPMATTGVDRLNGLRLLAQQAPDEAKFYLDRVKQLEIWRRRLNTVLPVLSALLGPKG